jgi:hypothetical protein
MRALRLLAAAGLVACSAAATAAPAAAATYTFGANLATVAPDPTANKCSDPVPAYGVPAGNQSCMATYLGTYPDTLGAPASGTITAVRVKVGPITGPMRVNVIRFLFQQNPGDPSHPTSAGPFLEAYGPQFTPNASATTQVATSLAMQEDPTPAPSDGTTIQVIDQLALEIDAPNVPIPAFADPGALSYLTYPSPTSENLPAPSPNRIPGSLLGTGLGVLMSADLTTGAPVITPLPPPIPPPAGPPPPLPVPPPPVPVVALPKQSFQVRDGAATIPVKCTVADCRGKLALLNTGGAATRATTRSVIRKASSKKPKKKQTTTYGTATFSAKAGKTASVKVKLNASGRALLKHHKKAKVYAKVTFSSGGGLTKSFAVTLKR